MDERKLGASPCPKALLIPVDGPLEEVELDGTLAQLQAIVGGMIEALPLPDFIAGADEAIAYVNDEGTAVPRYPAEQAAVGCAYGARTGLLPLVASRYRAFPYAHG